MGCCCLRNKGSDDEARQRLQRHPEQNYHSTEERPRRDSVRWSLRKSSDEKQHNGTDYVALRSSPIYCHSPRGAVTLEDSDTEAGTSASSLVVDAARTWELRSISQHPSFHGKLRGRQAKDKLMQQSEKLGGTCYLTRYSEREERYVLAVLQNLVSSFTKKNATTSRNYELSIYKLKMKHRERVVVEIKGSEEQFDCIYDLLEFYERNAVDHDIIRIGVMVKSSKYEHVERSPVKPKKGIERTDSDSDMNVDYLGSILDTNFTLEELKNIRWENDRGELKMFNLTERVSTTWCDAANMLGMHQDMITNYRQKTTDNVQRLDYVITDWIKDYSEHELYPATWRGLFELLSDLERCTTAEALANALLNRTE